jgi:hypothetical protein
MLIPMVHRRVLLASLCLLALPARAATPPRAMVHFDALYIPLLSLTNAAQGNAAQGDPKAAVKAAAAAERLRQQWPALRKQLAGQWPAAGGQRGWDAALASVDKQLAEASGAVARGDWKGAHEALETVRLAMWKARQAAGVDYFVDRLTAFHEPMELLALAGAKGQPAPLGSAQRAQLEQAFAEARALWRSIENNPPDVLAHALSPARASQLSKGLADEGVALARLSDALRGQDDAALLKAASAIKPPYARSYTAFGVADGEALPF